MAFPKIRTTILGSTRREVEAISGKAKEEVQHINLTDEPVARALECFSNSSKCQNTEACRILANMSTNPQDLDFARESVVKALTKMAEKGPSSCAGIVNMDRLLKLKLDAIAIPSSTLGLNCPYMRKGYWVNLRPGGKKGLGLGLVAPDGTMTSLKKTTLSGKPYTGVVKYFDSRAQQVTKEHLARPFYHVFDNGELKLVIYARADGKCVKAML